MNPGQDNGTTLPSARLSQTAPAMGTNPSPPPFQSPCDLCGALAPWATLLPLGQVDFVVDTPAGRQLTGSRPLRCCRPPWRQDWALHRAALDQAPLSIRRPSRFTRRPCRIQWQDLPGDGQRPHTSPSPASAPDAADPTADSARPRSGDPDYDRRR